jgi:predicted enzyme related to lactoylglutathione lyase
LSQFGDDNYPTIAYTEASLFTNLINLRRNTMSNNVNWFEIPVANMERAVKFYSEVFQKEMQVFEADETRTLALMPPGAGVDEATEPQGSLLHTANFEPSDRGTIVYFDPGQSLDTVLAHVEAAGGKITFPKFRIGHGYLATFTDSEGNTVGLLEWDKE